MLANVPDPIMQLLLALLAIIRLPHEGVDLGAVDLREWFSASG